MGERLRSLFQRGIRYEQRLRHRFIKDRPLMETTKNPPSLRDKLREEVSELLEAFHWGQETPTPREVEHVGEELADVVFIVFDIGNLLGIDVGDAVRRKIRKDSMRFPTHLFSDPTQDFQEVYLRRKGELGELPSESSGSLIAHT